MSDEYEIYGVIRKRKRDNNNGARALAILLIVGGIIFAIYKLWALILALSVISLLIYLLIRHIRKR